MCRERLANTRLFSHDSLIIMKTPVNVFTGFLGAGKTTIITKLIEQLPADANVVWLKNEYGDTNVDAVLAAEQNIKVAEIMNGCLCCVLVGRLGNAITEIVEKYQPSRIIIESSGTAYPLPIVLELQRNSNIYVDSVVTVIDALNFADYHETGEVARMQSKATDLYLLNKHEEVDEITLDKVVDVINDLNPQAVKVRTELGKVDPRLIFDTYMENHQQALTEDDSEHLHQHADEVDVWEWQPQQKLSTVDLDAILLEFKHRGLIRAKGPIETEQGWAFYNWVLGRSLVTPLTSYNKAAVIVFMGQDLQSWRGLLAEKLLSIK